MPRVTLAEQALADLERLQKFVSERDPQSSSSVLETLLDALAILERHPHIGRPIEGALRELVISSGAAGHVALYRVREHLDRVEVLALRYQREAGFG
ncbi:MAG TPA: type II toxin-antitoxin system RelE/ParE family toxin [Burkholderiaceae bacterium]|jgi:plasmid stabilization system protein ParE|nr:type II toxin-antitoxin system RelE/ParE family toxin [Burkholderiaceae bacterium]